MSDGARGDDAVRSWAAQTRRPRAVVIGCEKGGTGKSTLAIHVVVSLLKEGLSVATVDLDPRQGTLSRYLENREESRRGGFALAMPVHRRVRLAAFSSTSVEREHQARWMRVTLDEMGAHDVVVVDTPGGDSHLNRLAHAMADTLITPINDSFLDLDLLCRTDADGDVVTGPSQYSQMVWEQRQRRSMAGGPPVDWVVVPNRLVLRGDDQGPRIGRLLEDLAGRFQFRIASALCERPVYRELFPRGLTLLDVRDPGAGVALGMEHVSARHELRAVLASLGLPARGLERAAATGKTESTTPSQERDNGVDEDG
jgi:chromosome partitioning protein